MHPWFLQFSAFETQCFSTFEILASYCARFKSQKCQCLPFIIWIGIYEKEEYLCDY